MSDDENFIQNFEIKLTFDDVDGGPDPSLFLAQEPDRKLTRKETEWVQTVRAAPDEEKQQLIQSAPSTPALRYLEKELKKYSGAMPATKEQWQNYVMLKYYELANDLDPKVSKPALDALAKTNVVGLHTETQEININLKSTVELEAELLDKINKLVRKTEEKVINPEGEVL